LPSWLFDVFPIIVASHTRGISQLELDNFTHSPLHALPNHEFPSQSSGSSEK
jgi:hypothetical protein